MKDPAVRQLIQAAQHSDFSRRALLSAAALGGLGALSACAPPKPPSGAAAALKLPDDMSATEKIVRWANWTAYLDYDDRTKSYPTLTAFSKKTGIKATYSEDIDDNNTYYSKIAPQLEARQDIQRDIFVFTDWMATRVIRNQLCQPLDIITMPNAPRLLPALQQVSFDPGRNHSITWQSGFAGIGYNKKAVPKPIKTYDDLWQPALKGRITVLSEFRDTLGVIMLRQGVDISSGFGKEQFENAVNEVDKRINDGWIRRVKGNAYLEDLKSGNALAGIVWSGDIFMLRSETNNPNWEFVIPESGGTLWSDNLMIPITSTHRRNAMSLMNYYYDPKVAAEVAAYVNYVCPVQGAQAEMEKIDPELAKNPFIFPSDAYIKQHNIKGFRVLSAEEEAEYGSIWAKVIGD